MSAHKIALYLSAASGVQVGMDQGAADQGAYARLCAEKKEEAYELSQQFIGMIEQGVLGRVMKQPVVPNNPIDADEIARVVMGHQGAGQIFSELKAASAKVGPSLKEHGIPWVSPAGPPCTAYGENSIRAALRSEASRGDVDFFDEENMARIQGALAALPMVEQLNAVANKHITEAIARLPLGPGERHSLPMTIGGYLAAQPIYKLSADGFEYVDGIEVLFRGSTGDHNAPNLWTPNGYQRSLITAGRTDWATYQLAWARMMARRLHDRINFISVNFRLHELQIGVTVAQDGTMEVADDSVLKLILAAHRDFARLGAGVGPAPKLVIEITEYDQYVAATHLPIIRYLLRAGQDEEERMRDPIPGVNLGFDDAMPGKGTFSDEVLSMMGGNSLRMTPSEAIHTTTYGLGLELADEQAFFGTHKTDSKHSQKIFGTELMSWSGWAKIVNPETKALNTRAAQGAGGEWGLDYRQQIVNPCTRLDGTAATGSAEEPVIYHLPSENTMDPSRWFAVVEFLKYLIGTVTKAHELQDPENRQQVLDRFIVEVTISKKVIDMEGNQWFKAILQALDRARLQLFNTQGGPTGDLGLPVELFTYDGSATLASANPVEITHVESKPVEIVPPAMVPLIQAQ